MSTYTASQYIYPKAKTSDPLIPRLLPASLMSYCEENPKPWTKITTYIEENQYKKANDKFLELIAKKEQDLQEALDIIARKVEIKELRSEEPLEMASKILDEMKPSLSKDNATSRIILALCKQGKYEKVSFFIRRIDGSSELRANIESQAIMMAITVFINELKSSESSIQFAVKTLKNMSSGLAKDTVAFLLAHALLEKKRYEEAEAVIREISDGPKKTEAFLRFLSIKLSINSTSQSTDLNLSSLHIKKELPAVLEMIKNHNIGTLSLEDNELGDVEVELLATALKANQKIKKIILSNNAIRDEGAKALAQVLSQDREIIVTKNKIGPFGAAAFIKACIQAKKTTLDLSHNEIGNDGACLIADLLNENPEKIKQVFLKHNGIGFAGDKALAEKVPSHIKIFHRIESKSYYEAHPILSVIFILITGGFGLFLLPFMTEELDVEGCEYRVDKKSK